MCRSAILMSSQLLAAQRTIRPFDSGLRAARMESDPGFNTSDQRCRGRRASAWSRFSAGASPPPVLAGEKRLLDEPVGQRDNDERQPEAGQPGAPAVQAPSRVD